MLNSTQKKILNKLLDKYENSKSFTGDNMISQSFSVDIVKLFPRYGDDAEYDVFVEINDALSDLEKESFITIKKTKNGVVKKAVLNISKLDECYAAIKRNSKKEEQKQFDELYKKYLKSDIAVDVLKKYIMAQEERIGKNRKVEYYDGNMSDYEDLLYMVQELLNNESEVFVRDFSMKLFQKSKRAEQLQAKASAILFQYGAYEEREYVLEECGVVSTPTYVMIKGNGLIKLGSQELNLNELSGDIALSTTSIKELEDIKVMGKRVVTVENLTSFHDYVANDDFVIYLGGFHNKTKREFISFLYERNPNISYNHFGDTDAGGYYILEHLRRKTGISFMPLLMDKQTLMRYKEYWQPLSNNDYKRLKLLREHYSGMRESDIPYRATCLDAIDFMLENNCKLEQEAVN